MDKPMQDSSLLVEPTHDPSSERGISPLVQKKHGVRDKISGLDKPALAGRNQVRNVAEIVNNAPLRA